MALSLVPPFNGTFSQFEPRLAGPEQLGAPLSTPFRLHPELPGLRLQAKRHIAMHDGHLVGANERDHPYVTGDLLASQGIAFDRGAWRARIDALEADGATEITFQPAGHNIPRELEAFARMLQRRNSRHHELSDITLERSAPRAAPYEFASSPYIPLAGQRLGSSLRNTSPGGVGLSSTQTSCSLRSAISICHEHERASGRTSMVANTGTANVPDTVPGELPPAAPIEVPDHKPETVPVNEPVGIPNNQPVEDPQYTPVEIPIDTPVQEPLGV